MKITLALCFGGMLQEGHEQSVVDMRILQLTQSVLHGSLDRIDITASGAQDLGKLLVLAHLLQPVQLFDLLGQLRPELGWGNIDALAALSDSTLTGRCRVIVMEELVRRSMKHLILPVQDLLVLDVRQIQARPRRALVHDAELVLSRDLWIDQVAEVVDILQDPQVILVGLLSEQGPVRRDLVQGARVVNHLLFVGREMLLVLVRVVVRLFKMR